MLHNIQKNMRTTFIFIFLFFSLNSYSQEKIPAATLKTLQGKSVNIETICKKNKIVVVSLWATWCVPCINELDAINDEYKDLQDEVDFKLLAISVDDSRSVKSVKPLVNGKDWDFDVLLDTNNDFKRKLGIYSIPATLVVKNSKIVKRFSGYKPGEEEELLKFLKTL